MESSVTFYRYVHYTRPVKYSQEQIGENFAYIPGSSLRGMTRTLVEETKLVSGTENIAYNYSGQVYCYCPETNQRREMAYGGFEKERETLKYRCPARHYGLKCRGKEKCGVKREADGGGTSK